MAVTYKWYFSMWEVTVWTGERPDVVMDVTFPSFSIKSSPDSPLREKEGEDLLIKPFKIKALTTITELKPIKEGLDPSTRKRSFPGTPVAQKKSLLGLEGVPNPEPSPPPRSQTKLGFAGIGVHLQEALYVDPAVLKVIRLYSYSALVTKFPSCTKKEINTFRDAYSIGAFRQATLTIKAVRDSSVYAPFGALHTTTLAVSSCAKIEELSTFFSTTAFKVGPEGVLYKLVPGSFKLKTKASRREPIA